MFDSLSRDALKRHMDSEEGNLFATLLMGEDVRGRNGVGDIHYF